MFDMAHSDIGAVAVLARKDPIVNLGSGGTKHRATWFPRLAVLSYAFSLRPLLLPRYLRTHSHI
jgi:hypothetical protein